MEDTYDDVRQRALAAVSEILGEHFDSVLILADGSEDGESRLWSHHTGSHFTNLGMIQEFTRILQDKGPFRHIDDDCEEDYTS